MFVQFNSVFEYVQECDRLLKERGNKFGREGHRRDYHWDMGVDYHDGSKYAVQGKPDIVSTTANLINNIDASGFRDVRGDVYAPAFAGSRVSVPDYLGGNPMCMRRKIRGERTTRSVNVFVATSCSAGVSSDVMLKRGATILALLEYLQSIQVQVSLNLVVETSGRTDGSLIQLIRVESSPLDLSTAAFAIAHPAFARNVTYCYAEWKDHHDGGWPHRYHEANYKQWLKDLIGFQPGDVFVPSTYGGSDEIVGAPETWLQRHIEQILTC